MEILHKTISIISFCFIAALYPPLNGYADTINTESNEKQKMRSIQMKKLIVTAEKREQNSEKIPASVTAFSPVFIEDAQIQSMDDIAGFSSGFEFRNAGSRRHSFSFMRGIKNVHNAEPAIGYYVDGVSYSKSYMFDFPLFGIDRIEILKGPQGTLYGRNAMAGVINIITSPPQNRSKRCLTVTAGTKNLLECRGNLSGPLIEDKLFLGMSFLRKEQDGYMKNDVESQGKDGRYTGGGGARIKLKYLPSDKLDIAFNVDGQTWDEGAFPLHRTKRNPFVRKGLFPVDKEHHYSHDFQGSADTDFWGSSLNLNYDLSWANLTSITAYRNYQIEEFIDSDFSPLDMTRMQYSQKDKNVTQEIRLTSSENGKPFSWITGLYYFMNDSENTTTTYFRSKMIGNQSNPFGKETGSRLSISDGNNTGAALFGQGTYLFNNSLELTVGLRYEYEDAQMDWFYHNISDSGSVNNFANIPSKSENFTSFLPKASLAWHFTDNNMVYGTFAGGHRGGGFNNLSSGYNSSYHEEMSWLYEVGSKFNFPKQNMAINLSAFYMDIDDEQIVQFDSALNFPYTVNAGKSHRKGLEAELYMTPLKGLDINICLTALEAEYDEYSDPVLNLNYAGNQVFNVPKLSGMLGIQYRCPLYNDWNFMGRVDVSAIGKSFLDDSNTVEKDPYALVNIKLGFESERFDIYFWVKNLFDKEYVIFENTSKGVAEDGSPITGGIYLVYRL